MQYKGEDLDLRVPHGRAPREIYGSDYEAAAPNGRWSRGPSFATVNGEPLWVDEVLLACCNYAFDVAQANGAAEVDLEHLVNALTRVDAAARTLETRGVREGHLRRESAALIASEIPAANAGEAMAPRRSGDLEDVLRRASEIAHRRGSPATVDDVLWVLLHYNRDLPVVQLLRRLTPEWQRSDWARIREPQMPEPMPRPVPVQLVANEQARMSSIEDSLRLMQAEFAQERKLLMDLVRDIQRDVVAQRGDGAAFRGDLGQRLEGLERAVALRTDNGRSQALLAERISHLEQSVQGGLGEALRGTREIGQRLGALEAVVSDAKAVPGSGLLVERMTALEKAVHGGLSEGARNWANLGQRLAQLEAVISGPRETIVLDPVMERIAGLRDAVQASLAEGARGFGQIGQRLTAFESSIAGAGIAPIVETLEPRLVAIERRLEESGKESQRRQTEVALHLQEVGKILEAGRGEADRVRGDVADRLSAIESYLAEAPMSAQAPNDPAFRELNERVGGLERAVRAGFGDASAATSQMVERLITVERAVQERPREDDDATLLAIGDRLSALDRMLESRSQQTLSATGEIVERLRSLEQRPVTEAQLAVDTTAWATPIEQRLVSLEGSSLTRVEAVQTSIEALTTRLEQLDERMRSEALVTEEALRGRDQDFDFIYNEIKQVAQSQATLNSAVSDWRTESQEHFGAIASRLDKLGQSHVVSVGSDMSSRDTGPTTQAFDLPAAIKPKDGVDIVVNGAARQNGTPRISGISADDYALPSEPDRGFWYWLFGTSSVATANRQSNIQVDRMRQGIRDAREKRRPEA